MTNMPFLLRGCRRTTSMMPAAQPWTAPVCSTWPYSSCSSCNGFRHCSSWCRQSCWKTNRPGSCRWLTLLAWPAASWAAALGRSVLACLWQLACDGRRL